VNDSFADRALTFESQRNVQFGKDQVAASADTGKRAVFTDPGQLDAVLADHITAIHAAPGLSEAAKQELTLKDTHALTATAWIGSGEKDARGTLARLKRGLPEGLEPEAGMQLEGHLAAVVHQQDAEARQEQRIRDAEAKAAAAQQRAENGANLQQRWQGALDMAGNGATNAHPITLNEIKAAVPPREVEKTWNRYQDQLRGARAAGEMRLLSMPEQDAKLAELAKTRDATTDPAEYGDRSQAFQAAAKAAGAERAAFRADQASYVASTVPAVRQAFDEARQDPSKMPAAIELSMQHQRRIDPTADPVPLPKEAASNAVERWKAAPDAAGKLAALAPLTLGLARKGADGTTVDDTLARKSLDQLEAAGLPAGPTGRSRRPGRRREPGARDHGDALREGRRLAEAGRRQGQGALGVAGRGSTSSRTSPAPRRTRPSRPASPATCNWRRAGRSCCSSSRSATRRPARARTRPRSTPTARPTAHGATAGDADLGIVPVPRAWTPGSSRPGSRWPAQNVDVSPPGAHPRGRQGDAAAGGERGRGERAAGAGHGRSRPVGRRREAVFALGSGAGRLPARAAERAGGDGRGRQAAGVVDGRGDPPRYDRLGAGIRRGHRGGDRVRAGQRRVAPGGGIEGRDGARHGAGPERGGRARDAGRGAAGRAGQAAR
jgi:hypothetical protein